MAKKKPQAEKPRTDAERRARQSERLARVIRTLRCISGPGRWDVQSLAEELECSQRTVQRILQTLATAGIPFRYDPELRAYKVPQNFKFPGLPKEPSSTKDVLLKGDILHIANKALENGERLVASLRQLCDALKV